MTQPVQTTPALQTGAVASGQAAPRLRRVLGLWDLIFYGIVLIQPIGAIGIFGIANKNSYGHVTATILIALGAMMLTALSYGRMAALHPVAGSAYTYVGRGLNPHLGFVAGWAMFLDYLVIPVVSVIFGALTLTRLVDDFLPGVSHGLMHAGLGAGGQKILWVIVLVGLTTFLNIRGIKWTAHANQILTAAMFIVIAWFVYEAARFVWLKQGWPGLFSTEPYYNPRTFNLRAIGTATSLAALTYIGFDGITTLAEDVHEPKRTVPLSIVLVCVAIGLCAWVEVYLAQLAWPDYNTFKVLDTAFFDVCKLVGGSPLFNAMGVIMAIACLGSALTGQVGAARLLFGMGRDNALPRIFAELDHRNNPVLNIWLIGALALIGAIIMPYEAAAEVVNFGAFLAFMGVNAAAIREFCFRQAGGHRRNWMTDFVLPGLGFVSCLAIWLSLPARAKWVGGSWCIVGILFLAVKTRGFRTKPVMIDFSEG
jgi:putrescine importer